MRNTNRIALTSVLVLILTMPAFSQRGGRGGAGGQAEATEFQDFTDETNVIRKILLGEAFIDAHKSSTFRPQIDQALADIYGNSQNWPKVIATAERMQKDVPDAGARAKAPLLTSAMLAALRANDMTKAIQFGDWLLMGDPTDINPYQILSTAIPEHLPQDAAQRTAALNRAMDYAKKGIALQKSPRISDQDWNGAQAKLHIALGFVDLNMDQFPNAISEYEKGLKGNPKDAVAQYRLGLAYYYSMEKGGAAFVAAERAKSDAVAAKADVRTLGDLDRQQQFIAEDMVNRRDLAIDALARAVAIGTATNNPVAQTARKQLEPLFMNKFSNATSSAIDQLVSQKKIELGL